MPVGLFGYDAALGFRAVCGSDEAGRGCLAGPLVAAAVRFDLPVERSTVRALAELNDSKALSHATRQRLAPLIREHAAAWHVLVVSAADVDAEGVGSANLRVLGQALERVSVAGAVHLADGFESAHAPAPHLRVIKGDRTSAAIAAASVLAKTVRDDLMVELDRRHPGYGFAQHKGYPTQAHRQQLETLGLSPEHRRSFAPCAHLAGTAQ